MNWIDKAVIAWHRVRLHQSAYAMNGMSWLCQCGEKRGEWAPMDPPLDPPGWQT